ncbi:uncharacterized protein LOC124194209 isoform X2 [Daphnia pulex]|uniref:uncharacterized protein LOC124194209 isoform X2 n=1 Tax=Daphnia pulex TaxID=6669 RepID=UPI001EE13424|nr:uncharacterized protein LOC124194209 isoform X2 [Daphnia pulex]
MQFLRDLRTQPSIVTTQYEVFLVKVFCHQQQFQDQRFQDKKHPIALKFGMQSNAFSIELRISLFPLSSNPRVRPCECGFTLHRMDGATVDAWLYFPGTKALM